MLVSPQSRTWIGSVIAYDAREHQGFNDGCHTAQSGIRSPFPIAIDDRICTFAAGFDQTGTEVA
jgi:hypothetical protein